jgi:SCF-associated factor 1
MNLVPAFLAMNLIELPDDVLSLIGLELEPRDFLALCSTCKTLYSQYRKDSTYWRTAASKTFRLPISPLLAADGPRWYSLYKKLKTQTRLYTWGQGLKGNLGHGRALPIHPGRGLRGRVIPRAPHRPVPRMTFQRTSSSWPTETHIPDEVGVTADMQCGGWSTTILSSAGKLYTVGSLDSLNGITIGETADQFQQLEYLTQSTTAIKQFSAGRRHVLALTDDGDILSWDRVNNKGLKVFPRSSRDFGGRPTRVAAGWNESSAYIPETGIVYWSPIKNAQRDEMLDGLHVREITIPDTARKNDTKDSLEVTKHVVMMDFVIWITSDSKVYACAVGNETASQTEPTNPPFEVPGFSAPGRELKDIQGQFQNFGVFTSDGQVLAGNVDYLRRCARAPRSGDDWSDLTSLLASRPQDIPALQHAGIIGLAYGDHHYHALDSDGKMFSFGIDSMMCGQLGLSGVESGCRFRGLKKGVPQQPDDGILLPVAQRRGRQVWFEPEKKDWLTWMESCVLAKNFRDFKGRPGLESWTSSDPQAGAFSEWVEQEGRHWRDGPNGSGHYVPAEASGSRIEHYDDLDAYFTIGIAAAGWHSGALVLVDEEKAAQVRSKWISLDHESASKTVPGQFEHLDPDEEYVWKLEGFPKVQLPNGRVMPGFGAPRPWRDGRPTSAELGLPDSTYQASQSIS